MAKIESLTEALHLDGDRAKQMGIVLGKNTNAFKVLELPYRVDETEFGNSEKN